MALGAIGYGATLSVGGTSVGYIRDITGGGRSMDVVDATTNDSTGGVREKAAGLIEEKPVTVTLVFDSAAAGNYKSMRTAQSSRVPLTTLITLPKVNATATGGTSSFSMSAFITDIGEAFPMEGNLMGFDLQLTPSGAVTFNNG